MSKLNVKQIRNNYENRSLDISKFIEFINHRLISYSSKGHRIIYYWFDNVDLSDYDERYIKELRSLIKKYLESEGFYVRNVYDSDSYGCNYGLKIYLYKPVSILSKLITKLKNLWKRIYYIKQ